MTVEQFLSSVRAHKPVSFGESIQIINDNFDYRPVAFTNGIEGDQILNAAGQNEGSCRIFAFAQLSALNEAETLSLFGDFYRRDVLENPNGKDHQNIRLFMKYGWSGINFSASALSPK